MAVFVYPSRQPTSTQKMKGVLNFFISTLLDFLRQLLLMYDFHYNYIKQKYKNKDTDTDTDTDSLTYEIETDDVYQDFWNDKNKFDNSDYSQNSPYLDKTNKKIIGMFQDEATGIPVTEFIGLKSKMYSYISPCVILI